MSNQDTIQTLRLATGLVKLNKQETTEFLLSGMRHRDSAISAMTQAEGVELIIRPPQSSAEHKLLVQTLALRSLVARAFGMVLAQKVVLGGV